MSDWTFITNHGAVLAVIVKHGKVKAADIGLELGITERSVHRIIADLAREGYITRKREGRVNIYEVDQTLPLRSKTFREVKVQELLKCLGLGARSGYH